MNENKKNQQQDGEVEINLAELVPYLFHWIWLILIVGLLLSGCAGAAFTISSAGNRSTIEANNAADGATAQSGSLMCMQSSNRQLPLIAAISG